MATMPPEPALLLVAAAALLGCPEALRSRPQLARSAALPYKDAAAALTGTREPVCRKDRFHTPMVRPSPSPSRTSNGPSMRQTRRLGLATTSPFLFDLSTGDSSDRCDGGMLAARRGSFPLSRLQP